MAESYLLHFADGTEYGPVDRATLEEWHREGRIPKDALVWPDGAPEWLTIEKVLPGAGSPVPAPVDTAVPGPPTDNTSSPAPDRDPGPAARPIEAPAPAPAPREPMRPAIPAAPARPAAPSRPSAPSAPSTPTGAKPTAAAARPTAAAAAPAPSKPGGTGSSTLGPGPAPAGQSPSGSGVRPAAPLPPDDKEPDTRPPQPAPRFLRRPRAAAAAAWSGRARALGLVAGGVVLVLILLALLLTLLRPFIERRRAIAAVERHAVADRRVGGENLGFVVDLPPGWVALREDNPFVITRGARLRVAQPSVQAFGAVGRMSDPELKGDLDRAIDVLLQEQLPSRPSLRRGERADVQLGRGRGRLIRTTWDEDGARMQGALAVWADGYEYYSLDVWARASVGDEFGASVEELLGGIEPSGRLAARVDEAAERLAVEVPELPADSLRLLIGKHMAEGESLDGVPIEALRGVSRGIAALGTAEAEEMRAIYEKIWAPVPEDQRERLARVLERVKEGEPVPAPYLQALRDVVKAGVLELPAEDRERLRELSARALEKSFLLP